MCSSVALSVFHCLRLYLEYAWLSECKVHIHEKQNPHFVFFRPWYIYIVFPLNLTVLQTHQDGVIQYLLLDIWFISLKLFPQNLPMPYVACIVILFYKPRACCYVYIILCALSTDSRLGCCQLFYIVINVVYKHRSPELFPLRCCFQLF